MYFCQPRKNLKSIKKCFKKSSFYSPIFSSKPVKSSLYVNMYCQPVFLYRTKILQIQNEFHRILDDKKNNLCCLKFNIINFPISHRECSLDDAQFIKRHKTMPGPMGTHSRIFTNLFYFFQRVLF